LAAVPSTAASQILHLLIQSREKRNEFEPAVLHTDTCPHNENFWKLIFGACLDTKLGLFNLVHRTMDALDPKTKDLCWKCVVKLRNSICLYFVKDEVALLQALKNGSFSRTGKQLSDEATRDLRHSKRWKQGCSEFPTQTYLAGATTQRHGLKLRIKDFKDSKDPASGKPVLTRNTEKVATEQLKKVHHA
jgi:hypothetical protein